VRVLCGFDGPRPCVTVAGGNAKHPILRLLAHRRARGEHPDLAWHSRGRGFDSHRLHFSSRAIL